MVVQSGEDSAGGKDTKPVKTPAPWKYIAIAAVCAVAIIGVLAVSGIFSSGPAPIADTTASTSSGWQPPANPNPGGGGIPPNEPNETASTPTAKITKATKIPSPNEIAPYGTPIDISNPLEFVEAGHSLAITDIQVSKNSNKIKASYINVNSEKEVIIRPALIFFLKENKNNIYREQWYCHPRNRNLEYEKGNALCQWPEDFCYTETTSSDRRKFWEEYWSKKLGKNIPEKLTMENTKIKVGSTEYIKYKGVIPTIKSGEKYSFTINSEIPPDTKYILLNTDKPR